MSDENLLTSLNKRSLTEHLVDYVKKSKCFAPPKTPFSSKRGKFYSLTKKKQTIIQ